MFLRNLLFLTMVTGGILTLGVNLIPPRHGLAPTPGEPESYKTDRFQDTVDRVDASFQKSWSVENIQTALPAEELTIARRLSLGLMGTIPSLEEIRQFETQPSGERVNWWIDHILQDRRYADYLAERMARAFVGTEDGPFIFFRRRKFVAWLSEQITKGVPYDQVVREVIATEGLWTEKPATNFITVTIQNDKENQPDPVRLAGRVTRAFLGVRLDCAQCHDHPFAPWKQADFEGFSAFFGQTHVGFRGVYDGPGEYIIDDRKKEVKRTVAPKVAFAKELLPAEGTLREQMSIWVTHKENPYFARAAVNRMWALLCGQPLVAPVDNLETEAPIAPALKILADDFTSHDFDLSRLVRIIASTQTYRKQSLSLLDSSGLAEKSWAQFPLSRLRPEQVAGSVLQASSVATVNADSHLVTRLVRYGDQNDFIKRYGDSGDDEFDSRGGTIPQRLVMLNGKLVRERSGGGPFTASTRIQWLASEDPMAVELVFLAVLTRRPTLEEAVFFEEKLQAPEQSRGQEIQDLFWTLVNTTEFSWNH